MKKFMRTRPPPAAALAVNGTGKLNGHAKGAVGGGGGRGGGVGGGAGRGARAASRSATLSTLSRVGREVGAGGSGGGLPWDGGGGGGGGGCTGALWEDPEFPAEWRRVGDRRTPAAAVVWMRPHEMSAHAQYFGDDDDGGGGGGGCGGGGGGGGTEIHNDDDVSAHYEERWSATATTWWWSGGGGGGGGGGVAAAARALLSCPRLLARVLRPEVNTLRDHSRYNGIFSFMLWEWGTWREVRVDDRLPRRLGARAPPPDFDYTLPLLEKACAKLYGSYAALRTGCVPRALQDLTGGVVQSFPLGGALAGSTLAFHVLNSAVPRSTLLVAYIEPEKDGFWRALPSGLVSGQAYSVTGLARAGHGAALVRVRGGGGGGGDTWRGAWAAHSPEWRSLSERDRDLLADRTTRHEFWMSYAEFVRSFSTMVLVHVPPDEWSREPALRTRRPWRAVLARRRWTPGYNAGGDPDHTETTSMNPQFHLSVPEGEEGGKCHVVVAVCQEYGTGDGGSRSRSLLEVGFAVYVVPPGAPQNTPLQLSSLRPLDVTHAGRAREVATFFTLPAGRYLVAPHARRPHCRAAFLLRVLTDTHTALWEVNEDNVIVRDVVAEFLDNPIPMDIKPQFTKIFKLQDNLEELDAEALYSSLRAGGTARGGAARALARALHALAAGRGGRGAGGAGGAGGAPVHAHLLPRLMHLLHYWKHIYEKYGGAADGGRSWCGAGRDGASCYRLRALLWAAGLTCSNKVLEALAQRYGRGRARTRLALVDLALALCALHIAHERYRNLEASVKSNPLSLEEMILMTICS